MMKVPEMKQPSSSKETFEFNLGRAKNLRCIHHQQNTICGECDSCLLTNQLNQVKEWFFRAGDHSQRRFALGLIRRLHSLDLLRHLVTLLQPLMCKDYMYARSRPSPSLITDRSFMSSDRALGANDLEIKITTVWYWFQSTTYWTKWNFLLGILQQCEAHLLNAVGSQARTLLSTEQKAFIPPDQYESSSVASTKHSFDSEHHPELDLLTTAHSEYSEIRHDPFMEESDLDGKGNLSDIPSITDTDSRRASLTSFDVSRRPASSKFMETVYEDKELVNEDSDDDGFGDTMCDMDPACLVIPTSVKAHSGVARYKDFIHHLPVHLSKMILGMLDQVSLNNAVLVSKIWRHLGEQVQKEFYVQQHLWEEVMLMQGAAAQACNPLYAQDIDVAVPNVEPDTFCAIRTGEDLIEPAYKGDVSFQTAYTGYSTRNIIMEERNVYCGAYNVMVLLDQGDPHRVIHTNGGELIGMGSQDRRLRFINSGTGKETGLVISGHAGSIRCIFVNEKKGYVISGSYDTTIRCWSLETGKCQRIFRGHRDTISCMKVHDGMLVSGAKDHMCKVWIIATGKCIRTFKHRHAVTAVGLSEDLCISGCEGGKVKVWDMKTGSLIKKLSGHHEPVTDIKFDKWHIISASKDGYALAWSAQGNHKRCLTAFRHPKAVLCVEFMYLRVISGSADGKIRIWNMITGQCLRIMRGNSRSDPINTLMAIGNRITINTANTLLVLNFESVEYDYTLEDDSMPPMVQYSHYSNAPVRPQPYAYIRAQRMSKAGASNIKILRRDEGDTMSVISKTSYRPSQIPHSAKTLSKASMIQAKRIQSAKSQGSQGKRPCSRAHSADEAIHYALSEKSGPARPNTAPTATRTVNRPVSNGVSKPSPASPGPTALKARLNSANSCTPTQSGMVSSAGFVLGRGDDDSDVTAEESEDCLRRRVSWAFEHPLLAGTKPIDLRDTKALLRSQIRAKGDAIPPDFIYLAVNAIQNKIKPVHVTKDLDPISCEEEVEKFRRPGRPTSSPSRFDARLKVPIQDLYLDDFRIEDGVEPDVQSVAESKASKPGTQRPQVITGPPMPVPTTTVTDFHITPVTTKPFPMSLFPPDIPTSIPKACVIRPNTASKVPTKSGHLVMFKDEKRPKSAMIRSRPGTAKSTVTTASSTGSKQSQGLVTSGHEPNIVPMLMYPKHLKDKLEELKRRRQAGFCQGPSKDSNTLRTGNVSEYNSPFRNHVEFKLHTHDEVTQQMEDIAKMYERQRQNTTLDSGKKQRSAWLAKVKQQRENDRAATNKTKASGILRVK